MTKDLIKKIAYLSHKSNEGHIPSSLSILDILYVIYSNINLEKDKVILSKGHASLGLYVVLDHFGLLEYDINDFCKYESNLGGHPSDKIAMVEASTGSLGHGMPIAAGMALGKKIKKEEGNIYVIIGDGESNEGTVWETAMLASQHKLNNLYCIMDYNHSNDKALNISNILDKFKSFNWDILEINGHDMHEIKESITKSFNKPVFILANTIKGKGIEFMENNPEWHHKCPSDEELKIIMNK